MGAASNASDGCRIKASQRKSKNVDASMREKKPLKSLFGAIIQNALRSVCLFIQNLCVCPLGRVKTPL